ncbi:DNRLRE domain-containing protein [Streptomyces sp. NPDC048496]|uniref:DNRLRE domain-containing protein n=1 Tax=Streptomyces sp. NPDC048496 TaxID=3365558 RepID=UPI0037200829
MKSEWNTRSAPNAGRKRRVLPRIALTLAGLLVAEGAVTVATTGEAVSMPAGKKAAAFRAAPVPVPVKKVTEAADVNAARVAARLSGNRVEVLSERTETSTTYAEPDGSLSAELFQAPVRTRESDGAWADIDTELERVGRDYEPRTALADITVSGGGGAEPGLLASVERGAKSFGMGWQGALPKAEVDGDLASYDLGGSQTLTVRALADGFEQNVVLDMAPAQPPVYRIPLRLKGLVLSRDHETGRLLLKDVAGKLTAEAPAPVMWDSSTDPASGESRHLAQVDTSIETAKDGAQTLVLKPDPEYFRTSGLTYPVTVDPTSTLAASTDTWVATNYPDSQSSSKELKSGTYDAGSTKARSYLKFDVAKFGGQKILSANLSLYSYWSATCATSGSGTQIRRVTSSWTNSGLTWGAQPSTTDTGAVTSTKALGFSSACPAGTVNFNVAGIVQAWADGAANYGVQVRGVTETDSTTWRRYRSSKYAAGDNAVEPHLTVKYNSYPAKPTSVAITPSQVNAYNGKRYVTSLTPQLSAKVTDADGDTVKAQFEITPDPQYTDGAGYAYTATSAGVASGGTAKITVPAANAFPSGSHLRYRVRGYDGSLYGAWTGYTTFVLNTAKPAAPGVSCVPYTKDTWTEKNADGAQCTFSTTSTDGQGYLYGLNDPATPKRIDDTVKGSGGIPLTVTLKPGDGWHTLYARTIDSGGNLSNATTAYEFGVGDGADLLTPRDGDRPARRLSLGAKGKPTYTGVTYQYRRGETDAWANAPFAAVTKDADGSKVTGWPLATSAGVSPKLTWNITDSLAEDGPVDIRAAFTDGSVTRYSPVATVTVDRNAGTAPSESAGPGTVNLLTGDFTLSETDASAFDLSVTRTASSRKPDAGAGQSGQFPIYGKEWSAGTVAELTESDWSYLKQSTATSVALVDVDGEETGFTKLSNGGWKPEPGADDFTLTGSLTGSFTLKDTEGMTTVFTKPSGATTWQVASSAMDGLTNSTTTVVSETLPVGTDKLVRPARIIAPTTAASASTCTATPSTKGCRSLEFVYATSTTATGSTLGDFKDQLREIRLWATAPGASAATAQAVQMFAYDSAGRLRQAWHPQISPALKTEYAYDGAGRITQVTPPGELPWTMTYGKAGNAATAGDGMLLNVSRTALKQGTTATPEGTATTSIVYDVPLTGTKAPYAMGSSDTAAWGQSAAPTDATAVFPADAVPASHAGSGLGAGDYKRATVTYTDASGRQVNTAQPGGHISATDYDQYGNTVRELTARNRETALGRTAAAKETLADLGLDGLSSAARAELLGTRTVYDDKGIKELEEFGPARRVDLTAPVTSGSATLLPAGESVVARAWTKNTYDEGRPADGTATVENQVTKVVTGAQLLDFPAIHAEQRVTQTTYDWVKGLPTKTITDPSGLALTTTKEYDAQGRVTKELLPGATGTDAATRVTTYWSATGTGTCAGRPEWADLVCSTGPAGAVTGGGSNPSGLPVTTTEYDWYGATAKAAETANGVTRTTTTTYDAAGRTMKTATTGGLGAAVPDATTEYDPNTGQAVRAVSTTGGTITKVFDKLGREVSYTDADGGVTTTEYDLLGRRTKVTDSVPSTVTYTYDHTAEPRGLATKTVDSVAGAFTTAYDADGGVATERLPGGYTLTVDQDTTGTAVGRTYTRDSDGVLVTSDMVSESVHGQVTSHTGWSAQAYAYDKAGRLTSVDDTVGDVCTRRAYTFDKRTNRTRLTSSAAPEGADCTSTGTVTTTSHAYDSGDRLVDAGYAYDAFGRTTTLPGSSFAYYANDLVQSQSTDDQRQTWTLDASRRFRAWTVETSIDDEWTRGSSKRNHYDGDGDSPRWTEEDTAAGASGAVSRNVESASGDLAATTGSAGGTVLQLTNVHGDVMLALPLTEGDDIVAFDSDEYGNPRAGQLPARYGWLGGKQRSAETLTGLTLMGVRLYNPVTGRFLSMDPVYGGSANSYDYVHADPLNRYDLDGKWWSWAKKKAGKAWRGTRRHFRNNWRTYASAGIGVAGFVGAGFCAASIVCGVAVGAAAGMGAYAASNAGTRNWRWGQFAVAGGVGAVGGGLGVRVSQGTSLGTRVAMWRLRVKLRVARWRMNWKWRKFR